ncbi:MAG: hypothetical protein IKU19_01485, partial [Clostridia bacterium]|nr:hypothetical protein [Clostridia bacterium]
DFSGKKLLCTAMVAEGGNFASEIVTYEPYTDKEESRLSLPGSFAVNCGFFANGGYTVLADTALVFFDKNNNQIGNYALGTVIPTDLVILNDCAVLCYNENIVGSHSRVLVFSPDGEILHDTTVDDKVLDAAYNAEFVYLLTDSKLTSLNTQTGEQLSCAVDSSATGVFVCDDSSVVVDFSNMAKAYKLSEIFTEENNK